MDAGVSRRTLIHRAAVGGIALLGSGALASAATAAPASQRVRALRVALTLEHLQEGLYSKAARAERLGPALLTFARTALEHEREHIAVLRALLGPDAGEPPPVDLWPAAADEAAFAHRAIAIEDLAVRALNGQVALLDPATLAETSRIAGVDARHVAWVRGLVGVTPEHRVRDAGRTVADVRAALARAGLTPEDAR